MEYMRLKSAVNLASFFHLGFFYSNELEKAIETLAERLVQKTTREHIKFGQLGRATLHVISKPYSSGGHTRVLERWIQGSDPSQSSHHVLISQTRKVPKNLSSAINVHYISSTTGMGLNRALALSKSMRPFNRIVTHVHPNDLDAILALWINKSQNPTLSVSIFNHADHRFWIGARVADQILEFREFGRALTQSHRGESRSLLVGLPLPSVENPNLISGNRMTSKHIQLLAVGRGSKFSSVPGEASFPEYIDKFLGRNSEFRLRVIGPGRSSAIRRFPFVNRERIDFLGPQTWDSLVDFYRNSDVGIDSFPMTGGTITSEMSLMELPVVSLRGPVGLMDELPKKNWWIADNFIDWERSILEAVKMSRSLAENEEPIDSFEHWGTKVDALLQARNLCQSLEPIKVSTSRLENFLWSTEPRLSNFIKGRVL